MLQDIGYIQRDKNYVVWLCCKHMIIFIAAKCGISEPKVNKLEMECTRQRRELKIFSKKNVLKHTHGNSNQPTASNVKQNTQTVCSIVSNETNYMNKIKCTQPILIVLK